MQKKGAKSQLPPPADVAREVRVHLRLQGTHLPIHCHHPGEPPCQGLESEGPHIDAVHLLEVSRSGYALPVNHLQAILLLSSSSCSGTQIFSAFWFIVLLGVFGKVLECIYLRLLLTLPSIPFSFPRKLLREHKRLSWSCHCSL